MNILTISYLLAGLVALLVVGWLVYRRRPLKINPDTMATRWSDVQHQCSDKKLWCNAIVAADKMLEEVLKKYRFKGKSTGERLVRAQHKLSNNESVWFGHKLCNKIVHQEVKKVSKQDTLEALSGFRQALMDLGALRDTKPKKEIVKDAQS